MTPPSWKTIPILVIAAGLAACSSPERGTIEYQEAQIEERFEARAERVEETVDDLPDWFLDPPRRDGDVFGVGSATSHDVQFALDKAMLAAKAELADRVSSDISARLTQYLEEGGNEEYSELTEENTRIIVNILRDVRVSGYQVEEREIQTFGGRYRAYVLLAAREENIARSVVNNVVGETRLRNVVRSSSSYEELERTVLNGEVGF